jgi:hypothetical protein
MPPERRRPMYRLCALKQLRQHAPELGRLLMVQRQPIEVSLRRPLMPPS